MKPNVLCIGDIMGRPGRRIVADEKTQGVTLCNRTRYVYFSGYPVGFARQESSRSTSRLGQ